MARCKFTVSQLINLDLGKVDTAVRHELEKVVADIRDRPELATARRVRLTIDVEPEDVVQGQADTVSVLFSIEGRIPKRQTRKYSMLVGQGNELLFNAESPEEPRQGTLDEVGRTDAGT